MRQGSDVEGTAITAGDIEQALQVEQLRARFLKYTREAYRLLPPQLRPRLLDIGCGQGQQTMQLAGLSEAEIVGVDIDGAALAKLRHRVEQADLSERITLIHASLYEAGLPDESFDILWEEGVLHLLDASRALAECHRLLKPKGFLVTHETVSWFERVREKLSESGFVSANQYLLPERCWWTDYGAPLEARIRAFREQHGAAAECEELARHERDVAAIKEDPTQLATGLFILQRTG
jgi:SAM-dependent methyltransferase